jgi:hypothetical protein
MVSSAEAFQRAVMLALQVEVPMTSASVVTSNPDPTLGEECWKTDLEAADARSLYLVAARIQLEAVATT